MKMLDQSSLFFAYCSILSGNADLKRQHGCVLNKNQMLSLDKHTCIQEGKVCKCSAAL